MWMWYEYGIKKQGKAGNWEFVKKEMQKKERNEKSVRIHDISKEKIYEQVLIKIGSLFNKSSMKNFGDILMERQEKIMLR